MLLNKKAKDLDLKQPYVWLATWFGSGLMAKAPGTWGSLAAIPVAILIYVCFSIEGLIIAIPIVSILGFWVAGKFEKNTGGHDNQMIVIDEVVGQWITLLPALYVGGLSIAWIGLAFVFFRLFDIIKPWPVSWADKKLSGPLGVMADDIIAGIMAAICVAGQPTMSNLVDELTELLLAKKMTLVTAESCTGGLLAATITHKPGASQVFERGFITYSNEAKTEMLGVLKQLIDTHGSVSAQTAESMARGALEYSKASLSVSITGIAGPDGGTDKKPVGLVYFGYALRGGSAGSLEHHFTGTRTEIQSAAVSMALKHLISVLHNEKKP